MSGNSLGIMALLSFSLSVRLASCVVLQARLKGQSVGSLWCSLSPVLSAKWCCTHFKTNLYIKQRSILLAIKLVVFHDMYRKLETIQGWGNKNE